MFPTKFAVHVVLREIQNIRLQLRFVELYIKNWICIPFYCSNGYVILPGSVSHPFSYANYIEFLCSFFLTLSKSYLKFLNCLVLQRNVAERPQAANSARP